MLNIKQQTQPLSFSSKFKWKWSWSSGWWLYNHLFEWFYYNWLSFTSCIVFFDRRSVSCQLSVCPSHYHHLKPSFMFLVVARIRVSWIEKKDSKNRNQKDLRRRRRMGEKIDINGSGIYYEKFGTGSQPILILPGGTGWVYSLLSLFIFRLIISLSLSLSSSLFLFH